MGWLKTRWEGKFDNHQITVERNEVGRGFKLEWDGVEIAKRRWTWIGLGELHATATVNGNETDVKVAIEWGGLNGKCTVTVGDKPIVLELIK
jgi:hypothetical protein